MKKWFLYGWSWLCGILVLTIIFFIFSYVLWQGGSVITLNFLLTSPKGLPLGTEGGIFPAIAGTVLVGMGASLAAFVFSLSLASYLSFYSTSKILYELNTFLIQCASGIPSVLIGLFGYSFFLMALGIPRSLLSAGLTLSLMMIPFITLRMEKIFRDFPKEILVASQALGVSSAYMIIHLIMPARRSEIASTVALAAAYAMGATAPIMYTGAVLYSRSVPGLFDPFMALPFHLYILVSQGYAPDMAYGTAFVLMVLLLIINLGCHFLKQRRH